MLRFTIRDLLWLMVVVGYLLGWFLHIRIERQRFAERDEEARKELNNALNEANFLKYGVRVGGAASKPQLA